MQHFIHDGVSLAFIDVPSQPLDNVLSSLPPVLLIHGFASTHAVNWLQPGWVRALTTAGHRVIALDNRGHGESQKFYAPADYDPPVMARDVLALLDYLGIAKAAVMGYSMGARIATHMALLSPSRVARLVLGGLGIHLVDGAGLPQGLAEALEADTLPNDATPAQTMFRTFAIKNGGDLQALAACMRGSRRLIPVPDLERLTLPVLIGVGGRDEIAGDPYKLAEILPNAQVFFIPLRDHNTAVGDSAFKAAVVQFLAQ